MSADIRVTCRCGAPMIEQENSLRLSTFMACSTFPACRETQTVPAAVEVRRAGAQELPGFETVAVLPDEKRYPG